MKIVIIFATKLYALKLPGQKHNELRRLLNFCQDPLAVYNFLKANKNDLPKNKTINQIAEIILSNAEAIENTLLSISKNNYSRFEDFFKPLVNSEINTRLLSLQKGREQYLRVYAIKIDENCFLITGGAIKFTHLMEERSHTEDELKKINRCRDYLKSQGIFDLDSFHEWINEKQ